MANFTTITLDTTGPQSPTFSINGGAATATSTAATADFSTVDTPTTGYQIKVWGDLAGGPATEGAATWQTYTTSLAITLTSGDGSKTVNGKIRDDVGNETATLTDSITLDTAVPVVNITIPFAPTKISKVSGFNVTTGSFQTDTAVQEWKTKVVPAADSVHTAGTQIPTTAGSTGVSGGALAAATNQAVAINGTDLETASAGDGNKIVKIFAQDTNGMWSV